MRGLCVFSLGLIVFVGSASATLEFASEPLVVEAKLNDVVVLPCAYTDDVPNRKLIRLWTRANANAVLFVDTTPIYSNDAFSLGSDNASLRVMVRDEDSVGEFVCRVNENDAPELRHRIVLIGPPKVKLVPEDQLLNETEGRPIEFGCTSDSSPKVIITYTKNGEPISDDIVVDGMIKIPNLAREHAGLYTCTGDNGIAPTDSKQLTLHVDSAPQVKVSIQWLSRTEVEINCKVDSDSPSSVDWTYNSAPLKKSDTVSFSKKNNEIYTLRLSDIVKRDYGSYACRAHNLIGSSQDSVDINAAPIRPVVQIQAGIVDGLFKITTISPATVTKFVLTLQSGPRNAPNTIEIPVNSENEVPGGAVGEHTIEYKLDRLTNDSQYTGKIVAFTDDDDVSPAAQFEFRTSKAATGASVTTVGMQGISASLTLLLLSLTFINNNH